MEVPSLNIVINLPAHISSFKRTISVQRFADFFGINRAQTDTVHVTFIRGFTTLRIILEKLANLSDIYVDKMANID